MVNNLLHTSGKPNRLLTAARTWMTPGALLMLSEARPGRPSDIVSGLSPEWWFAGHRDLLPAESIEAMLPTEGLQSLARHVEADL